MSSFELANPSSDDDDPDDVFGLPSSPELPTGQERTAPVLARLALEAGLDRGHRALLRGRARVIIVHTPDAEIAKLVGEALGTMARAPAIGIITEPKKGNRASERQGSSFLRHVEAGRSLVMVSQDPNALLSPEVLAAADATIVVPKVSVALLRKVIRRVSGGVVRGLAESDIANLSATDLLAAIRPGLTAGMCVKNLRRAAAARHIAVEVNDAVPLEDLAMTAIVSSWSLGLLDTIRGIDAGLVLPDKLAFAVLEGPTGTGKTTVAKSLAKSAGWRFVETNVGRWFATGDGHLGSVITAAQAFFQLLGSSEIGIVGLIDEIDSLPNRATLESHGSDFWTPLVTYVLTEIDTLRRSGRPVILLGATNHFGKLDSALIRPRRLETRVSADFPDETERQAMFRRYLGALIDEASLITIARLAIAATPARIQSWSLTAVAVADAAKRPLQLNDLLKLVVPDDGRTPAQTRGIAIHESGHAIAALALGLPIVEVSTITSGEAGGWVKTGVDGKLMTRGDVERFVTLLLAGRAADILLGGGANSGARADIDVANRLLSDAMVGACLYGSLQTAETIHRLEWGSNKNPLHRAIASELERLMHKAMELVGQRQQDILKLADRLQQDRVMTGASVRSLLADGLSPNASHFPLPPHAE